MSLQLQIDQMLMALKQTPSLKHPLFLGLALDLANSIAEELVAHVPGVEISHEADDWDGMICVGITGDYSGPIPEPLQGLDDGGWEE